AGSLLRLWATAEDSEWRDGEALADRTGQYGYDLPPLVELAPGETHFKRLLWPRGLTSIGKYDIVAESVAYPVGRLDQPGVLVLPPLHRGRDPLHAGQPGDQNHDTPQDPFQVGSRTHPH